eukprot:4419327-Prorocentrum_lima.AAC.1
MHKDSGAFAQAAKQVWADRHGQQCCKRGWPWQVSWLRVGFQEAWHEAGKGVMATAFGGCGLGVFA